MTNVEDFLAHYGVKGMKWGVINENEVGGDSAANSDSVGGGAVTEKEAADAEAALKAYIIEKGGDPEIMKAKYGPPDTEIPPQNFYQRHKTAIHVGAGVAAAGLVAYGGYKLHNKYQEEQQRIELLEQQRRQRQEDRDAATRRQYERDRILDGRRAAHQTLEEQAQTRLFRDYTDSVLRKGSKFNVDDLDDSPVTLKAGHIFKRVSTEDETTIRAGGFYASHNDSDTSRYKAIFPNYWKGWGMNTDSGYVVSLRSNQEIKAPSRKKAFNIYADMIEKDPDIRYYIDPGNTMGKKSSREFAAETYTQAASVWVDNDNPVTSRYFSEVKRQGYNALVDENDAGALAKQPMRLLDGTMFTKSGSEPLSAAEIQRQQVSEAKKLGLV